MESVTQNTILNSSMPTWNRLKVDFDRVLPIVSDSKWLRPKDQFSKDVNMYSMFDILVGSSKCDPDPPK